MYHHVIIVIIVQVCKVQPHRKNFMNYAEDRLDRRSRHSGVDNLSPLEIDLKQAHKCIRESTSIASRWKGHELAGRTLRDAGLSPQASFHYAMAWILSHSLNEGDLNDS